jgi:SAM-dependent methyltransferase
MSSGDPIDPELAAALEEATTLWASPSLIEDPARPDIGPVAVLTMTPSLTVHTSDDRPGAELVDLVVSSLLGQGFDLVTLIEPAELAALPPLPDWRATLDATGQLLEIHEPDAVFYDGTLGHGAPARWHQALRRCGRLVVLVATASAPDTSHRYANILAFADRAARERGVRNLATRVMDAERLELADGAFDVALSRLGIIFCPDRRQALVEMRRVLRPGGRAVVASFTTPDHNRFFAIPIGVIRRRVQLPPAALGQPGRSAWADRV